MEAARVMVNLYDGQGRLVHTMEQGPTTAGSQTTIWSGMDENGQALPSGAYRVDVVASDASGADIPVVLMQRGVVQEVVFEDGVPELRVGDRWLSLPEVQSIQGSYQG